MSDIFISYKRENHPKARKLANALESRGWTVWWDPKLRPGENFDKVIEAALKQSKCVIVMWSERAVESDYVLAEATWALHHKKLVSVSVEVVELPIRFQGIHTPCLIEWDALEESSDFRKLVDNISSILGPSPAVDEKDEGSSSAAVETGKFFFSYASADKEFVLKLAEDLRSKGINLWVDRLDIPAGHRWDRAVQEALKASPCLLVVLSPASVTSDNVMDEVSFGLETHKRIVPILHKECDIPFRLRRLQYVDLSVGYDNGFKRLLQELKR